MKESKKARNRRKGKKDPTYSKFIRNKWDGNEPFQEFVTREAKLWNNLSSKFKRPSNVREKKNESGGKSTGR